MKDRITQFLKNEGISPAEFADRIGVQRSSVSHVLNGRNYPSASFIQKMLTTYKTLNPRWLLLGEGGIFESKTTPIKEPLLFQETTDTVVAVKSVASANEVEKPIKSPNNQIADPVQDKITSVTEPNPSVTLNSVHQVSDFVDHLIDNKDINRIIFFNTDKTFTVYTPSK